MVFVKSCCFTSNVPATAWWMPMRTRGPLKSIPSPNRPHTVSQPGSFLTA